MKEILLPTLQGPWFLGPKSRLELIFEAVKSILEPKVEKVDFKYRFFDWNWLISHSIDGF